jgi:DNA transposition AAA+ family ATPase
MPPVDHLEAVETSIVRFFRSRLEVTHQERAICVVSGPWGVGKTTALDLFAKQKPHECVVVKVERGSSGRGASPVATLQQTLEALRPHIGREARASLSNAYWTLRHMMHAYLTEWSARFAARHVGQNDRCAPRLTVVYDEAQYLSRDAIEMLRYWNDGDRTVTPFPLGLVFVGNSEFALEENASGESHLSGAVRSRALFLEKLGYDDVTDADLRSVLNARGKYQEDAISLVIAYFGRRRMRRDLRSIVRLDQAIRRQFPTGEITAEIVRSELALELPVSCS